MSIDEPKDNSEAGANFGGVIASQSKRKLFALSHSTPVVWSGFGMMGLIGWSVVVPTLLGVALGQWIDSRFAGEHSWTLMLMVAGLSIGCFNAIQFVASEHTSINEEQLQEKTETSSGSENADA
jgi:ATP synthase protein I